MSAPARVSINARFLLEPVTGLQRLGREVLAELDSMLEEGEIDAGRYELTLLTPARPPEMPAYRRLRLQVVRPFGSHAWEQLILPWRAPGFLLSLKSTAPVLRRGGGLLITDLQVFGRPEMHGRAFQRLYRFVQPRAARRAAVLMALSRFTAQEIERWIGLPASGMTVTLCGHEHALRHPADASVLERHGIEPGTYLLAASSLNANKNFAAVPRALRIAQLPGQPFVVAGGANPRVFEQSGAVLPPGAIYVGRVSDAELRALYEHARAFVFPSFYEGFGLPPLEAMALGCPVVCSNTSSLPEVGGDAVLYCNPADDADIARQIVRVLNDAPLRRELGIKGRLRAAGFRWRDVARRVWGAVQPLVDAGRG